MTELWQSVFDWSLSTAVRDSLLAFPVLECIHIYSMVSMIALFVALDMKLMGFALGGPRQRPTPEFAKVVLRWVWIPIFVNVITGGLMFVSNAPTYAENLGFRIKISLILVSLIYHIPVLIKATRPSQSNNFSSVIGRAIGVSSVLVWLGVIVASRWIAYT